MGSGKTALINILSRKINLKKGSCEFEQNKISSYSSKNFNNQLAVVPQEFSPPFGSVNKYLNKTLKKYSHITNVQKSIDDIARKMQFEHLMERKMRQLSPGQLRWILLAVGIASDTKVLLIDEIEQHLNRNNLNNLAKILYRKSNYDGVTIIASTVNKDLLSQQLPSVSVTLENGRIVSVRSMKKKRKKYNRKK